MKFKQKKTTQLDLTYVDQSYSSYNQSFLTIASIMEIDYPTTEITPYTDKKVFPYDDVSK